MPSSLALVVGLEIRRQLLARRSALEKGGGRGLLTWLSLPLQAVGC